MKRWNRLALLVAVPVLGITGIGLSASPAGAVKSTKTKITGFSATPGTLYNNGGIVKLSAGVSNATGCTFTSNKTLTGLTSGACSSGTVRDTVVLPPNVGEKAMEYKFGLIVTGTKTIKASRVTVTVGTTPPPAGGPYLSGVVSMTTGGGGSCALLTTGDVDCWGDNEDGELGNGTAIDYSITPTKVVGVGGSGTLSGVASLANLGSSMCALLTTSQVDCWGGNWYGVLGNGTTTDSYTPTQVVGVGGTGTLAGVTSLTSGLYGFCALLSTSQVDCWGYNPEGELGNGTTSTTGCDCSDTPTQVVGVGGVGTLSGVSSLSSVGSGQASEDAYGYCALLTNRQVDCWGHNREGELGNGTIAASDTPTQVVGFGGTGTLSGVISLTSVGGGVMSDDANGYCALLTTSQVDCWGDNSYGQLGNGTVDGPGGSKGFDYPTQVLGVGGTGTLSGVTFLTVNDGDDFCALLKTSEVDCWGDNTDGELGNGTTIDSDTPTQWVGVGGSGTFSGVTSLMSGGGCAILTTSQVDCLGGNPTTPTPMVGVGGTGALSGVTSLTSGGGATCALLMTSQVDCWGINWYGELGNPTITESDAPVQVFAPS